METKISKSIIKSFDSDSDLLDIIKDENEELPVKQWIEKYRSIVPTKDIFRLLCRNEFLSDKDLRLFAVWCARESLKLVENPDKRSIEACNVAERYANGEATKEELEAAADDAYASASAAEAARTAAWSAALDAAYANAEANIDNNITYLVHHVAADSDANIAYYAASTASYAAARAAATASYAAARAAAARADAAARAAAALTADIVAYNGNAYREAVRTAQVDKLLTYFIYI